MMFDARLFTDGYYWLVNRRSRELTAAVWCPPGSLLGEASGAWAIIGLSAILSPDDIGDDFYLLGEIVMPAGWEAWAFPPPPRVERM